VDVILGVDGFDARAAVIDHATWSLFLRAVPAEPALHRTPRHRWFATSGSPGGSAGEPDRQTPHPNGLERRGSCTAAKRMQGEFRRGRSAADRHPGED